VFPKTFMYGPKCEGDKQKGQTCNGGKTPNGAICDVCNGTNVQPFHTTATDVVVFPFPKSPSDSVFDLTKAMSQFSPDIDLVKFMEEYCDRLSEKAKGAVFPSQVVTPTKRNYNSQNQPVTATEQDYSWDNVYDAYRPFTAKYSYAWLFIARMIGIYTDNDEGLTLYHKFPSDFKLKPVKDLIAEAQSGDQANLPQHVMKVFHDDIANVLYADDPDTLTKIQIKNKFHPFSGKSEAEIQGILLSDDILPYYKILYIYFDILFDSIDEELGDKFYLMTYEKQKSEIKRRVDELIKEIDKQKATDFKEAQKRLKLTNDDDEEEGLQ
jgi:hypothetical protein